MAATTVSISSSTPYATPVPLIVSKPSTLPTTTTTTSSSSSSPFPSSSSSPTTISTSPISYDSTKKLSTAVTPKSTPLIHFIAGGLSGMTGALVTCPLEVVKTRLQSSSNATLTSTFLKAGLVQFYGIPSIFSNIYKTEGFTALWKGLGPTLLGVIPSRAIYFTAYDESKKIYTRWNQKESPLVYMASSITAGVSTTVTTNPLWMVKTRMQLQVSQQSKLYKNSIDCLYKVIRNEGVFSLYRGLTASLVGISESTIQWLIYEHLKKSQLFSSSTTSSSSSSSSSSSLKSKTWSDWLSYFGCAAVSKLTASILTYPHEVIRTRLREPPPHLKQYKYHGVVHAFQTILKEEGIHALYGGMSVHLLRVVPNTAIMFLCYEGVVHFAKSRFG